MRRPPRERPYTAPFGPTIIAVLVLSLVMLGGCMLALALLLALYRAHPGIVVAGTAGLVLLVIAIMRSGGNR